MFGSDDITWCASKCDNKECFRHDSNMRNKIGLHSYAEFKGTDTCPLTKKKMSPKEAVENIAAMIQSDDFLTISHIEALRIAMECIETRYCMEENIENVKKEISSTIKECGFNSALPTGLSESLRIIDKYFPDKKSEEE